MEQTAIEGQDRRRLRTGHEKKIGWREGDLEEKEELDVWQEGV